jgi:hypothetical protein
MKKPPSAGELLGLGGSPATAEQIAERARVKAHNADLLRLRTTIEDGVETETATIRREAFIEKCVEFVDKVLKPSSGDQLDRVEKGKHVSQVADYVFGSREPGYVAYVRKELGYAGPVDTALTDGVHVHVDKNGLVFKTDDPAAVEDLFVSFAEVQSDAGDRAIGRRINNIERAKALSTKRVPALKEQLEDHTSRTQVTLTASVLAKLKALEPPVRNKKNNNS